MYYYSYVMFWCGVTAKVVVRRTPDMFLLVYFKTIAIAYHAVFFEIADLYDHWQNIYQNICPEMQWWGSLEVKFCFFIVYGI